MRPQTLTQRIRLYNMPKEEFIALHDIIGVFYFPPDWLIPNAMKKWGESRWSKHADYAHLGRIAERQIVYEFTGDPGGELIRLDGLDDHLLITRGEAWGHFDTRGISKGFDPYNAFEGEVVLVMPENKMAKHGMSPVDCRKVKIIREYEMRRYLEDMSEAAREHFHRLEAMR
ncbi:MAG: hypothetical protein KJ709_04515 [Nanoarchaeota archaeon]|nr:hypothetical protein [Nanoarchaeota archaeon]